MVPVDSPNQQRYTAMTGVVNLWGQLDQSNQGVLMTSQEPKHHHSNADDVVCLNEAHGDRVARRRAGGTSASGWHVGSFDILQDEYATAQSGGNWPPLPKLVIYSGKLVVILNEYIVVP